MRSIGGSRSTILDLDAQHQSLSDSNGNYFIGNLCSTTWEGIHQMDAQHRRHYARPPNGCAASTFVEFEWKLLIDKNIIKWIHSLGANYMVDYLMDAQHRRQLYGRPPNRPWFNTNVDFIWWKDFACDADHVWFILFNMETNESRRISGIRRAPSNGFSILYVKWNWKDLNLKWKEM